MNIPTTVTSLDENCFGNSYKLEQLNIPSTVKRIPINELMKLTELQELTISSHQYELSGNRLLYDNNQCLYSIELQKTIKKINDQDITPFNTYTIPTQITKLSDYCFANCQELTEIKGIENVKEIGKRCFVNCPLLNRDLYPTIKQNDEEYITELITKEYQKQIEEWSGLKCSEIIFDSTVDDWSNTTVFNEKIIGKKHLAFIIEDEDNEIFGYYCNTQIINIVLKDQKTDEQSFEFNLQSKNNRLNKSMKY